MLLVAITGPVGGGKTTLLQRFVGLARANGDVLGGFTAPASGERAPGKGATTYHLESLDGRRELFAERKEQGYRFHETTAPTWAQGELDWIVLDELGKLEAKGEGHMRLWTDIQAAGASALIAAVREESISEIEGQLGLPFDVVIRTDDPGALTKLEALIVSRHDWKTIGLFGGGSGALEMSLGTVIHTVKLPLGGLAMAGTQAGILTVAAEKLGDKPRLVWISVIASGLKAFSPSGQKVRPMIAILMQGWLFSLAVRSLGWNRISVGVGGFLVGAWAIGQGILLQWLLVGKAFETAFDSVVKSIGKSFKISIPGLWVCSFALMVVAGFVVAAISLVAWGRRNRSVNLQAATLSQAPGVSWVKGATLDLLRPTFWIPTLLIVVILLSQKQSWQSLVWIVLQAGLVGWVLFALVRRFDIFGFAKWLRKRGFWGPSLAISHALRRKG